MAAASILFVSVDREIIAVVKRVVAELGHDLRVASSLEESARIQLEDRFDVVLLQVDALDSQTLRRLRDGFTFRHMPPVIALARNRSIRDAVNSIRAGASDYLSALPIDSRLLEGALSRVLARDAAEQNGARMTPWGKELSQGFITADDRMLALWRTITSAADTKTTVLIEGESGTGKTLLAIMLHENSCRRFGPFLEVNCSVLADTLLESELFGHVRGAFTSAYNERSGKFEIANGGTVLLDEIDNASTSLQMRLLRAVESGEFERVGDTRTIRSDVRLVAATNSSLEEKVRSGAFREDLYHRLNALRLEIPPLRERVVDIPLLTRHFLRRFAAQHRRKVFDISADALDRIVHYPWPGNVRELRNVIEHGVVMARGEAVLCENLPRRVGEYNSPALGGNRRRSDPRPLREALREPERLCILRALNVAGWNKQHAAADLGISRSTLYKKMKEYGLDHTAAADAVVAAGSRSGLG